MSAGVPCQAEMERPRTLAEALGRLADADPDRLLVAGGTDVMVWVTAGASRPPRVMDLWPLRDELGSIDDLDDGGIRIGSLVTYAEMIRDSRIRSGWPLVPAMAREVGAVQIQNRGTLGGNVAGASPAADGLTALVALDAEVELRSQRGHRSVPITEFNTAYRQVDRAPDELITGFVLPARGDGETHHWRKVGTRRAQSIGKVMLAAVRSLDAEGRIAGLRVALGSVGPTVIRARNVESVAMGADPADPALGDRVREACRRDATPIDDVRSTADYRAWVAGNLAARVVVGGLETPVDDPQVGSD